MSPYFDDFEAKLRTAARAHAAVNRTAESRTGHARSRLRAGLSALPVVVSIAVAVVVAIIAVTALSHRQSARPGAHPRIGSVSSSPTSSPSASVGYDGPAICTPTTDAATSGDSPAALEAGGTEVAGGTLEGGAWSLWAAKDKRGAAAIEDGGVVFGGREYGLCPGYPNPSESEMIDTGQDAVIYGVVNYPGLAKVQISTGQINSFAVGSVLPAPHVEVVDGVSFYIGTLPQPACSYHFFEVNTTSASYSAEHNIGFGGDGVGQGYRITNNPGNDGPCVTGKLDPLSYSEGRWHLPPGQFNARNGGGGGGGPATNSSCNPPTTAGSEPAASLTSTATQVASGTIEGESWSLWSKNGEKGANGLEDGGLIVNGAAYGLCPGYPNPAELETLDPGSGADGVVYGVVGYPGTAKVDVYDSTGGTFDRGALLATPTTQVVNGVAFFIGTLPASACSYPSLELNTTSEHDSAEHNLGFGTCTAGQLVPITASQGIWQTPPGRFPTGFGGGGGRLRRLAALGGAISTCNPPTSAATSGDAATTITATATQVASGTVAGQPWTLWSKTGEKGSAALEDAGLVLGGRAYGICPGFPNPAELEIVNPGAGSNGIVFGVSGYHGPATVKVSVGTLNTFRAGTLLLSQSGQPVDGTTFFIGELPASACSYPSLELDVKAGHSSSQHNLGFGTCTPDKLVQITDSMGAWSGP